MQSIFIGDLGGAVSNLTRTKPAEAIDADVRLVEAAQRGDRTAFGRLYVCYAPMVHGILLSRVPVEAAEDLVQDVFLQAMPKIASLREPASFGSWLAAISRNCAIDFLRRARPASEFDEELHSPAATEQSSGGTDKGEAQRVLDSIRRLPDAYRETLILRLVEGLTGPEIAARTGLTHGSVRVNLHRGMQQLREQLKR
jgi:RNA polymerase sigma-70 factor, ECF subfamily